jgi:hypothetical protein
MTSIISGKVTVSSAGTAVQFPSTRKRVIALKIQNDAAVTTGLMYVGDLDVSASNGWTLKDDTADYLEWPIPAGKSIRLDDLWADAASNDGAVIFIATLE